MKRKKLYDKTSANVGNDVGQYGRIEVENLGEEIRKAEKLDKYNTQSEINSQVRALEDAMTDVRDSRVMKDQIPFYDKVTGIYVVAPADSLPENTKMIVRVMGRETDEYAAARKTSQQVRAGSKVLCHGILRWGREDRS